MTGKTTEAYTLEGKPTFTHTGVAAIARGVELDAVYFLRGEEAETE